MYAIDYDEQSRILTVRLTSFWTKLTLARFLIEAGAKSIALAVRYGRIGIFIDCSEYQIQSADVADGFLPLIGRAAKRGFPMALVPHSPLGKLQADRTLRDTGIGIFLDPVEAHDWLIAQMAVVARARAA